MPQTKSKFTNFDTIKESINTISGAYSSELVDNLYAKCKEVSTLDDIYFAIVALFDTERVSEAMHLIRALFGITQMNYPYHIAFLESQEKTQEVFVAEFICDFYEIIEAYRTADN